MNRKRFCLEKDGSQEHITPITIMFCFHELAFTVQVIHKINSIQILGFNLGILNDYARYTNPCTRSLIIYATFATTGHVITLCAA